ncbi:MAG: hypothetical protein NE334_18580 [Lentisphaeraceae bacterium]|nr:hypothetical protein [Lentisphaeraceae bacterium]
MKYFFYLLISFSFSTLAQAEVPSFKHHKEYQASDKYFYNLFLAEYFKNSSDSIEVKREVEILFFILIDSGLRNVYVTNDKFLISQEKKKKILQKWHSLYKQKTRDTFVLALLYDCCKSFRLEVPYRKLEGELKKAFRSMDKHESQPFQKLYVGLTYLKYKLMFYVSRDLKGHEKSDVKNVIKSTNKVFEYISENNPELLRSCYNLLYPDFNKNGIFRTEVKELYNSIKINNKIAHWLRAIFKGKSFYLEYKNNRDTEEGKTSLANSIEAYKEAGRILPQCPEPFVHLIEIEKSRELRYLALQNAQKAQFDFPRIYSSYIFSLNGFEQQYSFALTCFESKRFDTGVPMILHALIVGNNNHRYLQEVYNKLYQSYEESAKYIADMERDVILRNMVDGVRRRDFNNFVSLKLALAVKAKNYADIKKVIAEIKATKVDIDYRAFEEFNIKLDTAIPYSYALAGTAGKLVAEINEKLESFKGSDKELQFLKQDIEDAHAISDLPETKAYFDWALRKIKKIEDFRKGEWVNINFTKYFSDFESTGKWTYESERSASFSTSGNRKFLFMKKPEIYTLPYEMKIDIEEIKVIRNGGVFKSGFLFGNYNGLISYQVSSFKADSGPYNSICFWVNPKKRKAGSKLPDVSLSKKAKITRHPEWVENDQKVKPFLEQISNSKKQTLRVKAWKNYYEFYVNDQLIGKLEDKNFIPIDFGIGNDNSTISYAGEVRFMNWQIKKLKSQPQKRDGVQVQ